jgi:hypothetical protein
MCSYTFGVKVTPALAHVLDVASSAWAGWSLVRVEHLCSLIERTANGAELILLPNVLDGRSGMVTKAVPLVLRSAFAIIVEPQCVGLRIKIETRAVSRTRTRHLKASRPVAVLLRIRVNGIHIECIHYRTEVYKDSVIYKKGVEAMTCQY